MTPDTTGPVRPPLSVRIGDLTFLLYAVWTLSCNVVVAVQGNLYALLAVAGPALLVTLVAFFYWDRWRPAPDPLPAEPERPPAPKRSRLRWCALGLVLVAGLLDWHLHRGQHWWWAPLLAGCTWLLLSGPARRLPSPTGDESLAGQERLVWAVALLAALVPLTLSFGTNIDDGYYVNLSVHVADEPDQPLLQFDTLHGLQLPVTLNVTRLTSYEVLLGVVSWFTGIPAIAVTHLLFPPLAAVLVVLAHARLLRRFAPQHYGWATAAAILFMFLLPVR
jgi:hypothetical protein